MIPQVISNSVFLPPLFTLPHSLLHSFCVCVCVWGIQYYDYIYYLWGFNVCIIHYCWSCKVWCPHPCWWDNVVKCAMEMTTIIINIIIMWLLIEPSVAHYTHVLQYRHNPPSTQTRATWHVTHRHNNHFEPLVFLNYLVYTVWISLPCQVHLLHVGGRTAAEEGLRSCLGGEGTGGSFSRPILHTTRIPSGSPCYVWKDATGGPFSQYFCDAMHRHCNVLLMWKCLMLWYKRRSRTWATVAAWQAKGRTVTNTGHWMRSAKPGDGVRLR